MPIPDPTALTLAELTTATVNGTGIFDVLMQANKAHLEQEFKSGRIKGNEYATVYLGSLQSVLNAAVQFALQREAQNMELAVKLAQKCLLDAQFDKTVAETAMVADLRLKAVAETALLEQKRLTEVAQTALIPKQQALLEAQTTAFANDHLAKMQDLRVKAWATARTTDPDNTPLMTPF